MTRAILKLFFHFEPLERKNGVYVSSNGFLTILSSSCHFTGTTARTVLSSIISDPSILSITTETKSGESNTGPIFSYLKSNRLHLLSSTELDSVLQEAMEALPEETELVKKGDERVLRRLIGEVMKRGKGRTDGKKVEESFRRLLMKAKSKTDH